MSSWFYIQQILNLYWVFQLVGHACVLKLPGGDFLDPSFCACAVKILCVVSVRNCGQ